MFGKSNITLSIYNGSLFALAIYLLQHYLPSFDLMSWAVIFFFGATFLFFILLKPYGEFISFEFVILMSCVLTHGFNSLWAIAIGMLGYAFFTRQTINRAMFYIGSMVLTVWGAAVSFLILDGSFGYINFINDYIAILGFITVYVILIFGFKVINNLIDTEKNVSLVNDIKDNGSIMLLALLVGVIAKIVYQDTGLLGLAFILLLMIAIMRILKKSLYSEERYIKTLETFLNITENKIPHFHGHSERVMKYCQVLTKGLPLSEEERDSIKYAALLHDIGKLGLPDKLLQARNYLTNDEVQKLQTHPKAGWKLVRQIGGLNDVAEIIYSHHENYDGSGYPSRLTGEDIPVGARVLAIANQFDHLLYTEGLRFEQACNELKNMAGSELDPDLVAKFIKAILDNKVIPVNEENSVTYLEDKAENMIEQLRYYIDKSWVLGSLEMGYIVLCENGELKNLSEQEIPDSVKSYLEKCVVKSSLKTGTCCKEFIIDPVTARIYDAYFVPTTQESCLVIIFDMTEILHAERDREEKELKIYRDVILAVTEGKLLLTLKDEIKEFIDENSILAEMKISDVNDVAQARAVLKRALDGLPFTSQQKTKLILCVSEAVTNVIKHVGEGKLCITFQDDTVRVVIQDSGPGIDISQLPQVMLRKGYSTKLSMGYGFTIMLDYLDRLIIGTKNGTTLILEMDYSKDSVEVKAKRFQGKKVIGNNAT